MWRLAICLLSGVFGRLVRSEGSLSKASNAAPRSPVGVLLRGGTAKEEDGPAPMTTRVLGTVGVLAGGPSREGAREDGAAPFGLAAGAAAGFGTVEEDELFCVGRTGIKRLRDLR